MIRRQLRLYVYDGNIKIKNEFSSVSRSACPSEMKLHLVNNCGFVGKYNIWD